MSYKTFIASSSDKKDIFSLRSLNYARLPFYEERFVDSLYNEDLLDKKYNSAYIVVKDKKSGIIIGSVRVTNLSKDTAPFEPEILEKIECNNFTFVDRLNTLLGFEAASMYLMASAWKFSHDSTGVMVALAVKRLCRLYKISAGLNYLCADPIIREADLKEPVFLIGGDTAKIFENIKVKKLNIENVLIKIINQGLSNE